MPDDMTLVAKTFLIQKLVQLHFFSDPKCSELSQAAAQWIHWWQKVKTFDCDKAVCDLNVVA